jgi:predicted RecB family endonuclease
MRQENHQGSERHMTEAVQQAVNKLVLRILDIAEHLSPEEAEALISQLTQQLSEAEEEQQWERTLASPEGRATLARLKAEAQAQIAAGKVHDLDELA